ncbi:right-handed parallel beta-helix repeat-containing protein [Yinghuangia sp. ASG 101]|uniref:right-handed parallel beta-helix repeat-containing protein n=1 Tax=Yinghuangia sp. ASG 101 TaxID=2896848 RepID=UPI001E54E9B9|nr:right-handed parallel beta-helix repeat-containing protein [Yinghuangia sp. ASG 101]UGQ10800.1 right-handed parallel beta-helix repeat-containing protein [Yinghuangia sp. ASG 101]
MLQHAPRRHGHPDRAVHPGRPRARRTLTGGLLSLAVAVAGGALAPPAHADPAVHVVRPGESVQAAVDAAAPGDTVELAAGTHRGSVLVTKDNLTLRGPRDGEAVLTPGDPAATDACTVQGYGVCAFGTPERRVAGVRVESLTVAGFGKTGVMGRYADGLVVSGVHANGNGEHGIGQEFSVRGSFVGNTADDNAQSGLFVGDETEGSGTAVAGNSASGNRIGVHVRRGLHTAIEANRLTGNCAGVFVVGDETRPIAGDLDITGNTLNANNMFCPGNDRIAHIQGSGVVLTGAQGVRISGNQIRDNVGDSPMSGGVVMVPSFTGAGNAAHRITGNVLLGNGTADIAERDPQGGANSYAYNVCGVSEPQDLC